MAGEEKKENQETQENGGGKKKGRLRMLLGLILLVLVLAGCGTAYVLYSQSTGYFVTDNAKVTAKMYSIGPVKAGQIIEWNVAAGDLVSKNQVLGAQDVLPYITSPIDGMVVKSDVAVGQNVSGTAQLAVVADMADMYIGVNIEETYIAGIRVGQETEVTIDAYKGRAFRGIVTEIDRSTQTFFSNSPSLSTSGTYTKVTQVVPVKVYIADPPENLAFGMNATVRINLSGKKPLFGGDKYALPLVAAVTAVAAGSENSKTAYSSSLEASESIKASPDTSGRVDAVYVKMGDQVDVGDTLFTLDSSDAELQLRQADAALQVAQVAYNNSRSQRSEGASVIPAQVARDEAQKAYDREADLFSQGASSQSSLDAAKARLETAEAQLSAAMTQSSSGVDTAAAQLKSASAALDIARKRLENCVVTSPMEGKVLSVSIGVGDMASPQSPAVVLINTEMMKLNVAVTESRIGQVREGMAVDISFPALGKSTYWSGNVSKVAPGVNPATGLFDVEVEVANADGALEAGMAAEVILFSGGAGGGANTEGVSIPAQAVFGDGNASYVYIVETNAGNPVTTLRRQAVAVEKSSGSSVVTSGVAAGELVALPGSVDFDDGMQVERILVR